MDRVNVITSKTRHGNSRLTLVWCVSLLITVLPLGFAAAADRVVLTVTGHDGRDLGRMVLTDIPGSGVRIDPLLEALPPGEHKLLVSNTAQCTLDGDAPALLNPVTNSVYEQMDDQSRMQVSNREDAQALANRRNAFLSRLAALKPKVEEGEPMPRVLPYTAMDAELALGNLPDLVVDGYGYATQLSFAPKITVAQLYGRSLHIHKRQEGAPTLSLGCTSVGFPGRP